MGVARGPFLLLPFTLVAAGAGAAAYDGGVRLEHTLLALLGLIALHMAVNIFNEYSDMRTGIDLQTRRTPFSGGSGTLPARAMGMSTALLFGIACAAVGLAVGGYFLLEIGLVMLPLIVVGAVLVVGYTDLLARSGVGEIAAGLGLGGLPVIGTALVQEGRLGPAALAAAVPATLMTFNLLLLNEFPDEEADRAGGRRNLVLLLGRRRAAWVYLIAGVATPGVLLAGVAIDVLPPLALAAAVPSLLLVGPARWVVGDPVGTDPPIPAMGANVAWNLVTNLVLGVTLLIAAA